MPLHVRNSAASRLTAWRHSNPRCAAIGDSRQVLVLDMGEPVKIVDLARDLIRLAGHTVEEIPIVFSGLRPGEKLFEELLADGDDTLATAVPRLRVARLAASADSAARLDELLAWLAAASAGSDAQNDAAVRARLRGAVAEYGVKAA